MLRNLLDKATALPQPPRRLPPSMITGGGNKSLDSPACGTVATLCDDSETNTMRIGLAPACKASPAPASIVARVENRIGSRDFVGRESGR